MTCLVCPVATNVSEGLEAQFYDYLMINDQWPRD